MDREPEEFQFMGLIGIYKESFKIIFKWRKLFSKITLALILPLTFIFLAHTQVSELIFSKINHKYHHLHDSTLSELIAFFLFEAAYLVILLMFSLPSTSAVVYPIASIYTAKEVTFKKVMTFVPKVWKRLMITFLWSFIILFLYNVVEVVFLVLIILFVPGSTVR
ncbi:uncharacterized protein LOC122074845 [Macadamia integrifolia]|uniref:uncharacterized protein LOC122074845 n=1 Tax=Macadamia integrifolia TaxID=60698 RepID=UPI001C4E5925|nr:uncharacterized protein LOC122074845 [Macadamia integrifolia]